jgi:hypothetical protein
MAITDESIAVWERNQRCCDAANAVLELLATRKMVVADALHALKLVKKQINETSIGFTNSLRIGDTLFVPRTLNSYCQWSQGDIEAEIIARQETSGNP